MVKFFTKWRFDLIVIFLLILTFPLFFYKLGQSSLISWDEAWYADISRNIIKTGDIFNLSWNGRVFFDHPPLGYYLEALTFKIFGISEFWARFPSALLGLGCLISTYFLGKKLASPVVGFSASMALLSAPWFLSRSRSGNLDILLTFCFILVFWLAFKAIEKKKFFIPLAVALAGLFLTKSLVPFTILPVLAVFFWKNQQLSFNNIKFPILIFLLLASPWFLIQAITHPDFLNRYLSIGFPGASIQTDYLANLFLAKTYLRNGIGIWLWPAILSLILTPFIISKRLYIFLIFFLIFLIPILFSAKIQIWHLIPLYPFMLISLFAMIEVFLKKIILIKIVVSLLILVFMSYFAFNQIRLNWLQFINIPAYISDELILSKEARGYPYPLYIDGDFDPAAAFYSQKLVQKLYAEDLLPLFQNENPALIITYQWRLDNSKILLSQYRIIKKDRDKILIIKK